MAKKERDTSDEKSSKKTNGKKSKLNLKEETRHGVYGVISLALGLFFVLSAFGSAGPVGGGVFSFFTYLVGVGYFIIPVSCLILGYSFIRSEKPDIGISHTIAAGALILGILGLIDVGSREHASGIVGTISAWPFIHLFGMYAGTIFLVAVVAISLMVLFDTALPTKGLDIVVKKSVAWVGRLLERKQKEPVVQTDYADAIEEPVPEEKPAEIKVEEKPAEKIVDDVEDEDILSLDEKESKTKKRAHRASYTYVPPPLSLLAGDRGKPNVGDIKANLNVIKRTLQNFGIQVEMDEVTVGPTVTRYALKPAEGVKLARILTLQNDLALALAAHPIRIEAPIPGKSLVGIEIPNKTKATVGLATLLGDATFTNSEKPLLIALGRSISGKPNFGNLAKMPHALIAGATGSGKSVTIHSVVTSLLYRNGPDDLRLIFIDPKRVELTLYNGIPHLLTPVITESKKAILSLKWAAKEMDRRYNILEEYKVRDLESYHNKIKGKKSEEEDGPDPLPYIVIIIDELADIMQTYPRELEAGIVRLAQMSRAVGIHLILSTQRPSVNVITGLIKANIPTRIALQVSSQIDSRTILDTGGAEKLLGAGDMLYMAGDMPNPERLQSAFISEDEVKSVVKFITENNVDSTKGNEISLSGTPTTEKTIFDAVIESDASDEDDLYEEARQTVIEAGKASTSFLQRKLKVGYARAARLIDMLEEHGVVGPGDGAKPREVLEKPLEGFGLTE